MTFLSTPIAVVVMLLLPVIEVLIPSFGGKMTVKELLYVGKFLVQTIWVECFQFWNPKVFPLFESSCNCLVVVRVLVICTIR